MYGKHKRSKKPKTISKTYAEIYKNSLLNLVKKTNSEKNRTLSQLIDIKVEETQSPTDKTEIQNNYLTILSLSLYFVKDNDFIKDEYFNLIDEKIYKSFDEFLKNPTEEEHVKFLSSFENLSFGYNNIYLICKKLFSSNPVFRDNAVNLFFQIILTEYFKDLKGSFGFQITNDQKCLISKLTKFIRIKYNYKELSKNELFELFKEEKNDNSIEENKIKEKIESKNEKNHEIISNIELNQTNEIIGEEEKSTEEKINITNEINNEIINNNYDNNFLNYLKKIQNKYQKLKYPTPVLDYVLKNKLKLTTKYFRNKKDKDSFIDHLYDYLETLLFSFNTNTANFEDNKVGYICFYDKFKKEYFEGIYSNIDLKFLYEKVVSDENFPGDDIYYPNEIIAKNAFK